jgi:hypothetical protein
MKRSPAYRRDMPLNGRRQRSPERVLFDAPAGRRQKDTLDQKRTRIAIPYSER